MMYTTPQSVSTKNRNSRIRAHWRGHIMQTEFTTETAPQQATDRIHRQPPFTTPALKATAIDERTRQAARRPATQRVRTVCIPTQVHPDLLIPYLYGEQSRRSISTIVNATGCAIDYCAVSPDEPPLSHAYVMTFLMSARSCETLESATRQLKALVERVQSFLQTKARVSHPQSGRDERKDKRQLYNEEPIYSVRGRGGLRAGIDATHAMAFKRGTAPDDRWFDDETDDDWIAARDFYAPDGSRFRERSRYADVPDVEADEKSEFVTFDRHFEREYAGTNVLYGQRKRPSSHSMARHRVRPYPDQPRLAWRSYTNCPRDAGYTQYTDDLEHRRHRQPRYTSKLFDQSGYDPHVYDDPDLDNGALYEDAVDLTCENASLHESPKFQYASEMPPRRSLKRPLSNVRSDGPVPPSIYRTQRLYRYEEAYDDEVNDWLTEEDEVAYGYDPHFRPVERPAVRRKRRFERDHMPQWSRPTVRGHPQMYNRRQIPDTSARKHNDLAYEAPTHEPVIRESARLPTARRNQFNEEFGSAEPQCVHARNTTNRIEIPVEDRSSVSMSSDLSFGHAVVETETRGILSNDSTIAEKAIDVKDFINRKPDSVTQVPTLDPTNNNEVFQSVCDKGTANEECVYSGTDIPIQTTSVETVEETAALVSPAKSNATTSSPPRSLPKPCVEDPAYLTTDEATCDIQENERINSVGRDELPDKVLNECEGLQEHSQPGEASTAGEFGTLSSNELQHLKSGPEFASNVVDNVLTDTIRINNHIIASLERVNKVEADFVLVKTSLFEQKDKFCQLANARECYRRLAVLSGMVYTIQYQLSFEKCALNDVRKQMLVEKLDRCLENLYTESGQTVKEKAIALQAHVENVLAIDGLTYFDGCLRSKSVTSGLDDTGSTSAPSKSIEHYHDKSDHTIGKISEDDDWYDVSTSTGQASGEDQDFVLQCCDSTKNQLRFDADVVPIKLEQSACLSCPQELPPFVWSLLTRVISADSQSYVMKATHKRVVDEIVKGDTYYYLHSTKIPTETEMSMPASRSRTCEFRCRGASAEKWKRKLVTQISSRMKCFDDGAYVLARRSSGAEAFNRKKMNSIIRKLHLVAMQVHALVSHLYCVQGHATCQEVDSLSTALNSSYYARKMGVYKSRLKLVVVPPTCQQQPSNHSQQASNAAEPSEALVQDTFEFMPELLLCVDIWGYNYRESQSKRHSQSIPSSQAAGSHTHFPLGFCRHVESWAFDFEHDRNGRLCLVCDELLNIVCLWNDFEWTDGLETMALDRVVSFETKVTASILKILDYYALHLQAQWAVRLLDDPEQLQSIRYTQLNAYYSDRSQSTALSRGVGSDTSIVDRLVAKEITEQRLVEKYWNCKGTALSANNCDNDLPGVHDIVEIDAISSWNREALVRYLLRWSDVYEIRREMDVLSTVTRCMLQHEVQKHKLLNHDHDSDTIEGDLSQKVLNLTTSHILTAISRAQMLMQDAVISAEKLALHSACHQLLTERKHFAHAEAWIEPHTAALATDTPTNTDTHELNPLTIACESNAADGYLNSAQEEVELDGDKMDQDQLELKDLIPLLAVTKQDIQKLCGHSPRSARMREKVQTQALQLARQTVELFRNIRIMYASQRR